MRLMIGLRDYLLLPIGYLRYILRFMNTTTSLSQENYTYDHTAVQKKWRQVWAEAKIDQSDLQGTGRLQRSISMNS